MQQKLHLEVQKVALKEGLAKDETKVKKEVEGQRLSEEQAKTESEVLSWRLERS